MNMQSLSDDERQRYREDCERNAAELGERVNNLFWTYHLDNTAKDAETPKPNRREFWQEAKEISNLFRTLRPMQKLDHDTLWDHFQTAIARMKEIEEVLRGNSECQAATLLERLAEVDAIAAQGTGREEIERGFEVLTDVMRQMKEQQLFQPDREQVWTAYQVTQERLRQQRNTLQSRNYSQLTTEISCIECAVEDDPYEALRRLKALQAESRQQYLDREHYQRVRERAQQVWDVIAKQLDERRVEKERRHLDWLKRQEANIVRWEESIQRQGELITRLGTQINELELEIWASKNDLFIKRAEGWVAEKRARITSAQESIAELQRRIDDVRSELQKEAAKSAGQSADPVTQSSETEPVSVD